MGGGEINLHLLASALVKKGAKVSVLTSSFPELKRFEIMDGIKVYRTLVTGDNPSSAKSNVQRSFLFPRSVVKEVKRLTKKQHLDVIHFIGASIMAAVKVSSLKIPLFATIESYPTLCPKGDRIFHGKRECKIKCSISKFVTCQTNSKEIGKMRNRWFFKYNPLFLSYLFNYHKKLQRSLEYCNLIAISNYMSKVLLQHGLQSTVIPNAIDYKKFQIPRRSKNSGKAVILYAGSLTKYKGPQILLQAAKRLPVKCELYGDGPLKEELQQLIKNNNLDATLHQPVPYSEIPQLYADSDIIAFPSIWPEPFGRISIEAMAAGKPIIGSSIGGIRETIAAGSGILVKPGDVEEFRSKLKELINKPQPKRKSIDNQLKRKYGQSHVIRKLLNVYNEKIRSI